MDSDDNKIIRYIKKLCESAFIIITIIHEIDFHYFFVILFQNNHLKLKTPPTLFIDFYIDERIILKIVEI